MASDNVIGASELALALGETLPRQSRAIARQSLNAAAKRGKTRTVQIVREQLNLPATYVRERVDVRTATSSELRAELLARKREVQLSRFAPRQNYAYSIKTRKRIRAGVSVQVKAGGARAVLPGAFLVKLKGAGGTGLALPAPGKYGNGNRRVEVLYGPSVNQVLRTRRPEVQEDMRAYLVREIERRLALAVQGKPGGADATA